MAGLIWLGKETFRSESCWRQWSFKTSFHVFKCHLGSSSIICPWQVCAGYSHHSGTGKWIIPVCSSDYFQELGEVYKARGDLSSHEGLPQIATIFHGFPTAAFKSWWDSSFSILGPIYECVYIKHLHLILHLLHIKN